MQKAKSRNADSQSFMAAMAELGVSTMVINYNDCPVMVPILIPIGAAAPPVGVCLFILSSVTGESLETVTKGTAMFYLPVLLSLIVVAFVPPLALWLPSMLG